MPTEPIYFKNDQHAYLKAIVKREDDIENISQAVQYCVDEERKREAIEDD